MAEPIISEVQFKYNPELVAKYGDYKTYVAEQQKILKTTSTWDLYNKGKIAYAEATARYDEANALYKQLKEEKTTAKAEYDGLILAFKEQNGEDAVITASQKSMFASKSGYTTNLINSTRDAEIAVDVALSARFNAVDTQRRGLYFNG